jgi:hypothetical protein
MENICLFTNCKKTKVSTSNYCYCKSHYPSKEEYEVVYNNILSTFQSVSINVNDYQEIKTFEDGSCMYNAMVKFLSDNQDKPNIKNNKHFQNLTKEWYLKSDTHSMINNETILTRRLQELLRSWIITNLDKPIIECGNILVRDMVLISHDPYIKSIEDYIKYYQIYAGDPDYIEEDNDSKKKNKKRVSIPTRWGSTIEAYAFKELFQVNVYMYTKYKFVKRTLNVTICSDKERSNTENVYRYKIYNAYHSSTNIYDPEKNLYLVYLSSKNHYLYAKKVIPEID